MRKGIAFEQIAMMFVAIVIVIIGISLVMNFMGVKTDIPALFKDSVNTILRGSYVDPKSNPSVVNGTYTADRVAKHVKACWDDTRTVEQDTPCIILRGIFPGVDSAGVSAALTNIDPVAAKHSNITAPFATTDVVVVYYDYSDDIIDVRG